MAELMAKNAGVPFEIDSKSNSSLAYGDKSNSNVTKDYDDMVTWKNGDSPAASDSTFLDPLYVLIGHYLIFVVSTPLATFGCFANVVNVVIFIRQGRRDCVSVCLLSLAVSDFLCCFTVLVFSWVYVANFIKDFSIVESLALDVTTAYISAMFYDISQGITAFISLQRCLCVAMPLKFKNMFTLKRSIYIMLAMYIFTCLAYTPHYRTCGLYTKFNSQNNKTITALWQSPDREQSIFWLNYILHIGVETFYQVVVVISAGVMIMGLKRSSKFRKEKAKAQTSSKSCGAEEDGQAKNSKGNSQTAEAETRKRTKYKHKKQANKNGNVAKTIFALAVMAIICNTERLMAVYGQRFLPGLTFDGKYRNFFFLTVRVTFLCSMVNASLNVVIYFSLNPSYRKTFLNTFCFRPKEDSTGSVSK